jgi:hypothetical protein
VALDAQQLEVLRALLTERCVVPMMEFEAIRLLAPTPLASAVRLCDAGAAKLLPLRERDPLAIVAECRLMPPFTPGTRRAAQ